MDEVVTLGDVWRHASRFFTRMPLAVLGTWAGLTVLTIALLVWQNEAVPTTLDLLFGNVSVSSLPEFILVLLAAQVVSVLRTGLFLPAKVAYRGGETSWSSVLRMAFDRFLPVLDLNIKIGFILTLINMVCMTLGASFTAWVVLPIIFLLQPAQYYATAHQMTANRALRRSIAVARRHWMPIFLVFGGLTCLSMALPSLVDSCTAVVGGHAGATGVAAHLGRATMYIGAEFLGFLASCGLFFALDEKEN
jgi:hypothetical protein